MSDIRSLLLSLGVYKGLDKIPYFDICHIAVQINRVVIYMFIHKLHVPFWVFVGCWREVLVAVLRPDFGGDCLSRLSAFGAAAADHLVLAGVCSRCFFRV